MTCIDQNLTIIIRSVGERTEQVCRQLIASQGIPYDHIVVVREVPFSASLRKSYQIGLERHLPWTLCVDADVLLRPKAIDTLIGFACEQNRDVFEIQGFILDKFFGGPRHGGPHLYRTALLDQALPLIPDEGINIRPEGYTLERMKSKGFPYRVIPYLTGLHDFEQYYRDIYRKCFVQAHKHLEYADLFVEVWREGAVNDDDFKVALNGFADGIRCLDTVSMDVSSDLFQSWSANLTLIEKEKLVTPELFSPDIIEDIIEKWKEPPSYSDKFPTKAGLIPNDSINLSNQHLYQNFQSRYKKIGILKMIPYALGWIFAKISERLISLSDD